MKYAKQTFKQIYRLTRKLNRIYDAIEELRHSDCYETNLTESTLYLAEVALESEAENLVSALMVFEYHYPTLYKVAGQIDYSAEMQIIKGIGRPDYLIDKTDPYITGEWTEKHKRFYTDSSPERPEPRPMRWDELVPQRKRSEYMFSHIPF